MGFVQHLLSTVSTLAKTARRTRLEGAVVPGSWNPATATCQVQIGDTAAFFADSNNQAEIVQCTLSTSKYGRQYGPVGGERALVEAAQGGWTAEFEHADDDTPGVPAGEEWNLHAKTATVGVPGQAPTWDAGIKLTNDGAEAGDALGGTLVGHQGGLTQAQTKSGHQIRLDDTAKAITTTTAGGLLAKFDDVAKAITHQAVNVKTIVDGQGNALSHIVPVGGVIGLGALASTLNSDHAVFRHSDISSLVTSLIQQSLQTLATQLATAAETAGVTNASAWLGIVSASGWVSGLSGIEPTIPNGSSIVRAID